MPVEIEVTYSLEIAGKKVFFPDEQTACIVRNALNMCENDLRPPTLRFLVNVNDIASDGPHAAFEHQALAKQFLESCFPTGGNITDTRKGEALCEPGK